MKLQQWLNQSDSKLTAEYEKAEKHSEEESTLVYPPSTLNGQR